VILQRQGRGEFSEIARRIKPLATPRAVRSGAEKGRLIYEKHQRRRAPSGVLVVIGCRTGGKQTKKGELEPLLTLPENGVLS